MCGIIGAYLIAPGKLEMEALVSIFHESQIRGMHATGMAYVKDGNVTIDQWKEPASECITESLLRNCINEDGNLYLIGHTRYSTSDIEYNQPIGNRASAIVHNGVITQEPYEKWSTLFPEYFSRVEASGSKNDSALLYASVAHHSSEVNAGLELWEESSIASIQLWGDKRIRIQRNGKRPAYVAMIPDKGYMMASTRDILHRSGFSDSDIRQVGFGTTVAIGKDLIPYNYPAKIDRVSHPDLQPL